MAETYRSQLFICIAKGWRCGWIVMREEGQGGEGMAEKSGGDGELGGRTIEI